MILYKLIILNFKQKQTLIINQLLPLKTFVILFDYFVVSLISNNLLILSICSFTNFAN